MWSFCDISGSVINFSSSVLSKVEEVFSLGLSFSIKPINSIPLDFVSAAVNSIYEFPCVTGIIVNDLLHNFNSPRSIPRIFYNALEKLQKDDSILITKVTKATVVIMD